MMNNVFFSVVIPTYNRVSLLRRAVDSVLSQQFSDFELLVIDDGSTDNTEEMVNTIADPRLQYKKIKNSERGAARNVGIRGSRGKYVTFLDSDDYLYDYHLTVVHKNLLELDFPEVFHQGYVIMDNSGRVIQKSYQHHDIGTALFTKGNIMSCMGVFGKRKLLQENLFNESRTLAGLEDWELWIRLASKFPIGYDPSITSVLMQHPYRGSIKIDRATLEDKCNLFIELISANSAVRQKYGSLLVRLASNVYTYLSLNLSDDDSRKAEAWRFLMKGIKTDKSQFFRKRTLAILRNVLFAAAAPILLNSPLELCI